MSDGGTEPQIKDVISRYLLEMTKELFMQTDHVPGRISDRRISYRLALKESVCVWIVLPTMRKCKVLSENEERRKSGSLIAFFKQVKEWKEIIPIY